MKIKQITAPLDFDALKTLHAGDIVELSGSIYTARDAAHRRIKEALDAGSPPPVDFSGGVVFYAGPAPTPPGRVIGSIAATTSIRMDKFLEMMYRLSIAATIGKGERTAEAAALCKKYGRVYFLSTGGAAAIISRQIKSCRAIAYDDLGAESIKLLEVEHLRLIVGIDAEGVVFGPQEIEKYRQPY
ncbi:MAG: FumA C-terminus/TtdB family hydratase beta subunit [Spirochaetaceae bacterium]|nr:FumA C-terminus/TtdB family hydratase beta subunit [Spirochaetaceae bacterium]